MPSADDLLDTFETPGHPPAPPEEEDPWGFNTPPSATEQISVGKKKKGKKKLKKNATSVLQDTRIEPVRIDDAGGDESPAYPSSLAPSPPKEQGVKLDIQTDPPTPALASSPLAREPLVNITDDDDSPSLDDAAPVPLRRPSPELPTPVVSASSPSQSPRPTFAEPTTYPKVSPAARPATLHNRHSSLSNAYRPSTVLRAQPSQRRESFTAATPFPRFVEPPPPHMPQAHFFGLPDFGLNLGRKPDAGKPAGADGYCCSLDSLADAGNDVSARKAREALLVGSDGGMEVYRVLLNKLEVVGRLEGLRGAVMAAKILPSPDRLDPLQSLRPLVAIVVHGPMQENIETGEDETNEAGPRRYQTTVEVYSLLAQTHLATLYKSAPVTAEQPSYSKISNPPGPVGHLHLSAAGRFIVIVSGQSGEVLVFTHTWSAAHESDCQFRCIGKFWTSVQRSVTGPARSPSSDANGPSGDAKEPRYDPLFSLGQRWLAVVPPMLSSNISIAGVPLLSDSNPNPPGLTTHVAPPQPLVNCEVAGTDIEGTWTRLGRQAAQGLVKYSQRGIQMGLHGWKELTQPSPPTSTNHARTPSKEDLFPPTKGPSEDPNRLAREPAVVSVIDLYGLLQWEVHKPKHLPAPMATFALVDGCNFVSLSSTGTKLLTTSRKGELSLVWDLAQVAHGIVQHTRPQESDPMNAPCIKQLHRIARSTPSTVLDCAWSRDDDALALLTAHGTVHLHEIPKRPLIKRRKRRSTSVGPAPEKADATTSLSMGLSPPSSGQGFLGSIKSSWQNVSTQVNSIRSTNPAAALGIPTTFAGFREATAAAGNAGSRAVARGLSQGYTAAKGGASDYWHAEDNKIRHKALQDLTASTSLRWIRRHSQNSLAISCGGTVQVHPIQRVERRKGDDVVTGLKSEKYARKAFTLPSITTTSPTPGGVLDSVVRIDPCTDQGPHGFWSLRISTPTTSSDRRKALSVAAAARSPDSLIPDTDVETNPPYCPFHVDPRVDILAFDSAQSASSPTSSFSPLAVFQHQGNRDYNTDAWTFGSPLPPSTKVNEGIHDISNPLLPGVGRSNPPALASPLTYLDDGEGSEDGEDDAGTGLEEQMESQLTIRHPRARSGADSIRINTRRRPRETHGNGDGSGRRHDHQESGMMLETEGEGEWGLMDEI